MGIFAGCQIESINEPSRLDKSTVYEASTEVFTPQTKTSMTSDKQVVWTQNDRLAIFQGCAVADEFLVTDSSDVQPENALEPKLVTEDGMLIVSSDVQP